MVCLSKSYPFKYFKSCLPQILLDPFLNTLSNSFVPEPVAISKIYISTENFMTKVWLVHTIKRIRKFKEQSYGICKVDLDL